MNIEKKKHSIIDNVFYVYKGVMRHKPYLLILIMISAICTVGTRFTWLFLGKYIIGYIAHGRNISEIFRLVIGLSILNAICLIGQNIVNYGKEPAAYYVRPMFMLKRNLKHIDMMYEKLEHNDVLDAMQKAKYSTSNLDKGIEGVIRYTVTLCTEIITCFFSMFLLMQVGPIMILLVIFVGGLSYFFISYATQKEKYLTQDSVTYENRKKEYFKKICDDFSYGKDIRLFNLSDRLLGIQIDLNSKLHANFCKAKNIWILNRFLLCVLNATREGVMYIVLIVKIIKGVIEIGDFLLYTGCVTNFANSFQEVLVVYSKLARCSREVDDYRAYIDFCGKEYNAGMKMSDEKNISISFRNVSYKYPYANDFAIKNLNIDILPNQKLAIVGLNGAGKTTFIKLLQRLYDPTEGEILINGVNIRKYDIHEYYNLFSTVFQDMECYPFTLAENVSMKPEAITDKDKATECIIKSGLKDKLLKLEKGIDSPVLKLLYDDGFLPSGGEKQKIALARALYKDAPIVILDEPTAALDAMAESDLYEKFNELVNNKISIFISHRLASTKFCDVIAMFEDGKIIEYGSHKQLMDKKGKYATMYQVQSQYYKKDGNV